MNGMNSSRRKKHNEELTSYNVYIERTLNVSEQLEHYISLLHPSSDPIVAQMKEYAKQHRVPIIEEQSLVVLLSLIMIKQPKAILEIGTAIGYSALRMAKAYRHSQVVTVDIDEDRLAVAKEFLSNTNEAERIHIMHGDACEEVERLRKGAPYDFIFIDAAKGQYRRYFDTFFPMLASNGIIVSDNVFFKGMVYEQNQVKEKYRTMIKKLREYNEYLANHSECTTSFYAVGDGLAVSIKKE